MASIKGSPLMKAGSKIGGNSIGLKAPSAKPNNLTATTPHKPVKGNFRDMKY